MKQRGLKRHTAQLALRSLFLLCLIGFFLRDLSSVEFHGDESDFILSSVYFKYFFLDRDFNHPAWKGNYWVVTQPPLTRYIIGLSWWITGHDSSELPRHPWDFGKDEQYNIKRGAMPSKSTLLTARAAMAILTSFTCFIVYLIGERVKGWKAGLFSSLSLIANPRLQQLGRRAMGDSPLLFFLALSMLIAMNFVDVFRTHKRFESKRAILWAVILGITIGLATATKLNGALAGISFAIVCVWLVALHLISLCSPVNGVAGFVQISVAGRKTSTTLCCLFIAGLMAVTIFILINPFFYEKPLEAAIAMINHRIDVAHMQQEAYVDQALYTISQRLCAVIRETFYAGGTFYLTFHVPFDLALAVIGFIILLYTEAKEVSQERQSTAKAVLISWIVVFFGATILFVPLEWPRYFLPLQLCSSVLVGFAIGSGLDRLMALHLGAVHQGFR